jgi:CheY-like chemotaxis protein
LLVEDNDVNREVIAHLLRSIGGTVTVAENGSRAVELAGSYCFDLIFMDCQMPIMDGYEATERIRKEHGVGEVPIIALTAHVTVADRERCFAAGMEAYLGKPCSLSDLRTILIQWLPDLLAENEGGSAVRGEICEGPGLTVTSERSVEMDISSNRQKLHGLRNIYSKIMGNTELALLSLNSPEKLEKYLERILSEIKKAAEASAEID